MGIEGGHSMGTRWGQHGDNKGMHCGDNTETMRGQRGDTTWGRLGDNGRTAGTQRGDKTPGERRESVGGDVGTTWGQRWGHSMGTAAPRPPHPSPTLPIGNGTLSTQRCSLTRSFGSAPPNPLPFIPKAPHPIAVPIGEVGRAAGDVVATKSAICRRAHTWDELFPFFICSWMRLSNSSLKDCGERRHRPPTAPGKGTFGGTAVVASPDGWWHFGGGGLGRGGSGGAVVVTSLSWWWCQWG